MRPRPGASSWPVADATGLVSTEESSRPVDENLTYRAAPSSFISSDLSTFTLYSNFTPARTSASGWGTLSSSEQVWADSISL